MTYVIIIETRSSKKFHYFTEKYSSNRNIFLLEEFNLTLPKGERLKRAECQRVKSLLDTYKRFADIHKSRDHVFRTEPGILQNVRKTLPRFQENEYVDEQFAEYIGEPLNPPELPSIESFVSITGKWNLQIPAIGKFVGWKVETTTKDLRGGEGPDYRMNPGDFILEHPSGKREIIRNDVRGCYIFIGDAVYRREERVLTDEEVAKLRRKLEDRIRKDRGYLIGLLRENLTLGHITL